MEEQAVVSAKEALELVWESLCDGCGKCCIIAGNKNAGTGVACPSLDVTTNRCTNYADRLTTETCLKVRPTNVESLHRRGILPDSCAYVRFAQGKGPDPNRGKARLIPFNVASPAIGQRYLLRREEWLSKREGNGGRFGP